MYKIKLALIFGGMSTENEVSVVSGTSILKNLNREKYEIYPIYIDKQGSWYEYLGEYEKAEFDKKINNIRKIDNIIDALEKVDVIFPVLHGLYGEDGTIQGLFELLKKPYVGCKVLASCVGMDKVYSKIVFEKAGIKQAKYVYARKYEDKYIYIDENLNEQILELEKLVKVIMDKIKFPMFVKPSNSGSSVGINKAKSKEDLMEYIECV